MTVFRKSGRFGREAGADSNRLQTMKFPLAGFVVCPFELGGDWALLVQARSGNPLAGDSRLRPAPFCRDETRPGKTIGAGD